MESARTFPNGNVTDRADLNELSEAVADLALRQSLEEVEVEEGHLRCVVGTDYSTTVSSSNGKVGNNLAHVCSSASCG